MVHCFLEYDGRRVDLTEGNANGKNGPINDFLFTQKVEADISQKAEYLVYRQALADLIQSRPELKGIDIKLLLRAREDGIKLLRANIGQS
jgi:hypothetical protein